MISDGKSCSDEYDNDDDDDKDYAPMSNNNTKYFLCIITSYYSKLTCFYPWHLSLGKIL